MKYQLPADLEKAISDDMALHKIRLDGERNKASKYECYEAIIRCTLSRNNFLFAELGRFLQKHGPIPEAQEENPVSEVVTETESPRQEELQKEDSEKETQASKEEGNSKE